jgi:thiol-disulfide isomerase/thioredoxin
MDEPQPAGPVRRRRVGPFSLRQVTVAILAVMGTAIGVTVASVPVGRTGTSLPVPEPSAFLLGSPVPGLSVGDLAPELSVDKGGQQLQLLDLDGSPVRLADLRGKVVWVNFWASWCPPCQFETPTLRTLDQRYRDRGLRIVSIQVQQTVQAGRDYASRYGLDYTIGADVTGDFFHLYRGFALPTQFFLDTDGRIREIINGPMAEDRAVDIVEGLLPPGPSNPGSAGPSAGASPAAATPKPTP